MAHLLAVERVADRIRQCVFENRVTLISGKTGCGKSSRVPQLLQAELNGPIICTQPRRLAVVAIAKHVAELTGSELGRDVGFRIGQKSVASTKTKLLFTTAGLLLEELRANGAAALKGYSCLIVDELHERSVESDLLLACIHAMMVPGALAAVAGAAGGSSGAAELPSLKLVLMSATANVERYKQYFKLPGDHVALIQCDMAERMSSAIGQWLETVKVVYLENVVGKVLAGHRNSVQHMQVLAQHQAGTITPQTQVGQAMQMLIRDLIVQLHLDEKDPEGAMLVFLPTYRALELQHRLLQDLADQDTLEGAAAASLELFPLHSSVDIDEAMKSMQLTVAAGRRKVILATNVAESSITIPQVRHVIDAYTTNQVYWDKSTCRENAAVIWSSQSAAEQRAGRTGRTCTGTCYRLLPRAAFLKLDKFESPALTLRSLRREVLCLLSASSRSMADPIALLAQALDPPDADVVADALQYLQEVGLARTNAKNRLEPSPTGTFLASLPLALESSLLLARGGLMGHLWEAAVLAALMNTTPYPIKQPFGSDTMAFVKVYYFGPDSQGAARTEGDWQERGAAVGAAQDGVFSFTGRTGSGFGSGGSSSRRVDRPVQLLANLAAFEAWQQQWCDLQRLKQLVQGPSAAAAVADSDDDAAPSAAEDDREEQAAGPGTVVPHAAATVVSAEEALWCQQHHLVPSSLRHVMDTLNIIVAALHKFRPCFIHTCRGPPEYYMKQLSHNCWPGQDGTCSCSGLSMSHMHSHYKHQQLLALLSQVFEAGTAAADAGLLMLNNNSNSCINGHSCDNSSSGIYTWTCEAQSAAETAPTASAAEELGLIEVDPDEQDYNSFLDHKAADENSAPLCRFFMSSSGCRRGAACVFRHVRPPCRFFLSRSGCKYGADCRFLHHTPSSTNSSSGEVDSSSSSDSAEDQQQGLAFDWGRHTAGAAATTAAAYEAELIRNNNGGSGSQQDSSGGEGMILLLGEGDFSFTAALLKKRQAARAAAGVVAPAGQLGAGLVATSYETQGSLRKIYTGRALADRLDQLQAAGVDVRYGVDALRLSEGLPKLQMNTARHIVWNFPLAVTAEAADEAASRGGSGRAAAAAAKLMGDDGEANRQLIGKFFAEVARQMASWNPEMKLHLALCLDQYGRWGVDHLARNNFLFQQQSQQLHLTDWPGYTPRRGLLDGSFPTDRAVVYTFVLALPMAHIPSLPKLQVQMRLQEMRQLLLQARRMALSADHSQAAAAAGEPCGTDSAAGVIRPARSSTASSQEALCAATSMAAGLAAGKTANKAVSRGGAAGTTAKAAAEAVASRRTVTARRSARLADRQAVPALRLAS